MNHRLSLMIACRPHATCPCESSLPVYWHSRRHPHCDRPGRSTRLRSALCGIHQSFLRNDPSLRLVEANKVLGKLFSPSHSHPLPSRHPLSVCRSRRVIYTHLHSHIVSHPYPATSLSPFLRSPIFRCLPPCSNRIALTRYFFPSIKHCCKLGL